MGPTGRRTLIVATFIVLGAALGALAAVVALTIVMAVVERTLPGVVGVVLAAGLGAALGAVFGPATLWTILPHVPLGRAIGVTFTGTVLGALAGSILVMPHVGAIVGLFAAAVWLSAQHPKHVGPPSPPDAV